MNKKEEEHRYGKVIHKGKDYVVRLSEINGEVFVKVHHLTEEGESLPRGYMLGSNALIWESPEKTNTNTVK